MAVSQSESDINLKKLISTTGKTEADLRAKGGELGINLGKKYNPEETRRLMEAFAPAQAPAQDAGGFKVPEQANIDTSQQKALQSRVLETLTPTAEETDLTKGLSDLLHSRELGAFKAGQQPIETGFVTGQQKAITDRARIQAMPLENQLAALQAKRQSASDVLTTSLGFEGQELARQTQASQFGQNLDLQVQTLTEQARQFGISEARMKELGFAEINSREKLAEATLKLQEEQLKISKSQGKSSLSLEREKLAEMSRQFGIAQANKNSSGAGTGLDLDSIYGSGGGGSTGSNASDFRV